MLRLIWHIKASVGILFDPYNKNMYLSVDNKIQCFSKEKLLWEYSYDYNPILSHVVDNHLFIKIVLGNFVEQTIYLDKSNGTPLFSLNPEYLLHIGNSVNNLGLVSIRRANEDKKIGLFDLSTKEIRWEIEGPITLFVDMLSDDHLYCRFEKKKIVVISTTNGQEKWVFDLNNHEHVNNYGLIIDPSAKLDSIIGIWKDTVWVPVANDLLILKTHTGQPIELIKSPTYMHSILGIPWPVMSVDNTQFDTKTGKAIGLIDQCYWEIDLDTLAVDYQVLSDEFDAIKRGLSSSNFAFDEDYLYFIDKSNLLLVVLDRRTRTVLHHQSVIDDNGNPARVINVQVNLDRLYVRALYEDYVFEIEKPSKL
jgi:hypothetical protein